MTVADAGKLHERLDFMGVDERMRAALRELRPSIADSISPALDVFYKKASQTPATSRLFSDARHIEHAKSKQIEHWQVIAAAEFGSEYAGKVQAIGRTHARLGLEPRWYIGGYALITEQLLSALISAQLPGLLRRSKNQARATPVSGRSLVLAALRHIHLATPPPSTAPL